MFIKIRPNTDNLLVKVTCYNNHRIIMYFKLDFSSSLIVPHAVKILRSNISSRDWYLLREVFPLMADLLSQCSYQAVPAQPFHGEILCDINALEGIRNSDHLERVETNYQLN